MQNIDMSPAIAFRIVPIKTADGHVAEVRVVLGTPVPDPRDPRRKWMCPYEITAFGERVTRAMFGIDAMQALVLTLHTLPTEMKSLAQDAKAQFLDEHDFGIDHACRTNLGISE